MLWPYCIFNIKSNNLIFIACLLANSFMFSIATDAHSYLLVGGGHIHYDIHCPDSQECVIDSFDPATCGFTTTSAVLGQYVWHGDIWSYECVDNGPGQESTWQLVCMSGSHYFNYYPIVQEYTGDLTGQPCSEESPTPTPPIPEKNYGPMCQNNKLIISSGFAIQPVDAERHEPHRS